MPSFFWMTPELVFERAGELRDDLVREPHLPSRARSRSIASGWFAIWPDVSALISAACSRSSFSISTMFLILLQEPRIDVGELGDSLDRHPRRSASAMMNSRSSVGLREPVFDLHRRSARRRS